MPAPRKCPLELIERGARMVLQMRTETGACRGAVARVAACTADSRIDFPRAERYELSAATADVINERRRAGGRVMVCGTSALRTMETVADDAGLLWPQQGFTQLTISPGHQFRACDAFLTNLHAR